MKTFSVFLILAIASVAWSAPVCNIHCDDRDASEATGSVRDAVVVEAGRRRLILRVADEDNMAFGWLSGEPGEEVWIERTFNGGLDWDTDGRIGSTRIPNGASEVSTHMFNVDDPNNQRIGALRACTLWPGDGNNGTCTPLARSTVNAEDKLDAAVTAMMMFYEPWRGLWKTVGWWNAANDMNVLIDYQLLTGRRLYNSAINNTFELNKGLNEFGGVNFTFGSIDDNLWWGLTWVKAYDLTGEQKYLDMAVFIADFCYEFHDDTCGGGVWWSDEKTYKNAVTNEQYIKLSIQLHNRIQGDTKYLRQSQDLWNWFRNSGMINQENLVNDGLRECRNNNEETWTYNQGIVLGALVELHNATRNQTYLDEARKIADAVMNSTHINDRHGVLWEPCFDNEPDCGPNAPVFKGVYMRNLGELDRVLPGRPYTEYILHQAEYNYRFNRNPLDQYGLFWSGPLDFPDASRQQSVVDSLLAAEMASRH